jgi:2-polyprenyl-3-methyl-5-hydroxy-6-metoxy-1,4-benzoquinol methylase
MIVTWSQGAPEAYMPEAILTELSRQVRRHPWWQARARLILALLLQQSKRPPARVLDAGCGWGVTIEALEKKGYRVTGLDVSRRALERLDRPGRQLIEADLARPFPHGATSRDAFDAVLALDVIEHLDDDRGALSQLVALVRPGGVLIVSVPALPDLFSEFDRVQGHRRRYRPEDLRTTLEAARLRIEQILWWGSWLVPLLRMTRKRRTRSRDQSPEQIYLDHLKLPPWPLPALFRLAFALEQRPAVNGALWQGTSLLAVARKLMAPAPPAPDADCADLDANARMAAASV